MVVVIRDADLCRSSVLGLLSHSITPALVAGCLVVAAAFGRPSSVTRRSGRLVRTRVSYDYVLLATGAVYSAWWPG